MVNLLVVLSVALSEGSSCMAAKPFAITSNSVGLKVGMSRGSNFCGNLN